jgi:hypothetical protein
MLPRRALSAVWCDVVWKSLCVETKRAKVKEGRREGGKSFLRNMKNFQLPPCAKTAQSEVNGAARDLTERRYSHLHKLPFLKGIWKSDITRQRRGAGFQTCLFSGWCDALGLIWKPALQRCA